MMAPEEDNVVEEVEKVVGGDRSVEGRIETEGEMFETKEERTKTEEETFETKKEEFKTNGGTIETEEEMFETKGEIGLDGDEAKGFGRYMGKETENEPDDERKGSGSKVMAGDDSESLSEVSS